MLIIWCLVAIVALAAMVVALARLDGWLAGGRELSEMARRELGLPADDD